MDVNQFDALTTRVITTLSRRSSLGLLGALSTAGLGLAAESEARKKGKKKRPRKGKGKGKAKCSGCTACQACVDGVCEPLAEGVQCGTGGVCMHDVCAKPCTSIEGCPAGAVCPVEDTVCVTGYDCSAECATDADCASGEICIITGDCGVMGFKRCATIAAI